MTRILAVADEVVGFLDPASVRRLGPDLVVACGDLPFDYLESLANWTDAPVVFVPGNHDPGLGPRSLPLEVMDVARFGEDQESRPQGCVPVDRRIVSVAGLVVGGLGGSPRYSGGPNQYTQGQMRRRAWRLAARSLARHPRRRLDLLITHAPPLGVGDEDDVAHRGFAAFHRLVGLVSPRVLVHGHIHPYGRPRPDRWMGRTRVVNAAGYRMLEVDPGDTGEVTSQAS